jgi:hypothetical protein
VAQEEADRIGGRGTFNRGSGTFSRDGLNQRDLLRLLLDEGLGEII